MKIGIMTFWESRNNYGQILQLFALQSFLEKNGHEPYLIKYFRIPQSKVVSILKPLSVLRFIKRKLKEFVSEDEDKDRLFDVFKEKNISFGRHNYYSVKDLKALPPLGEAYIVGSDQIWNNNFSVSAEAFLLDFGSIKTKRIAYAASFGQLELDNATKILFEKHLPKFSAISVREKSGLTICKELGISNVKWVLDPTFLFSKEEWITMLDLPSSSTPSKSIFVYTLGNSEIIDREKFIGYAKQIPDIEVVHASANSDSTGIFKPTIPQWVNEILKSKLVLTTSFHGMVFSLINNTNFIVLPNTGKAKGMNERITSLLSYLELTDHIMPEFSSESFDKILNKEMPWDAINKKLQEMKELSKEFLLGGLS